MSKVATIAENESLLLTGLELGPYGTNAYIVVCRQTGESVLVDAPAEAALIQEQLRGTNPKYILMTHGHFDHTGALAALKRSLAVPVAAHIADSAALPVKVDLHLQDGAVIPCGKLTLAVMHTPGHTAGSICFRMGAYLLAGDTIFPGGPGRTESAADFKQLLQSIAQKIMTLPGETVILPGHGPSAVLKEEKALFDRFMSRPHKTDLCGSVTWLD